MHNRIGGQSLGRAADRHRHRLLQNDEGILDTMLLHIDQVTATGIKATTSGRGLYLLMMVVG